MVSLFAGKVAEGVIVHGSKGWGFGGLVSWEVCVIFELW